MNLGFSSTYVFVSVVSTLFVHLGSKMFIPH